MHPLVLAAALAAAPAVPDAAPLRAPGAGAASTVLPGVILLALAVIAFVLGRGKVKRRERLLEVVDTASLGPRRSIAVVRVGGDALVLGVSEAGVALLATRPADALAPQTAAAPATFAAARAGDFESLVAESVEHQELRRKLQRGGVGGAP